VTTSGPSLRDPFSPFRTLPGRLFLLSTAILVVLLLVRQFAPLPEFVDFFRKVVRLAWFGALVWLTVVAVRRQSHRFLWRVRQKLILSYIFLGFVPVILIAALTLVGGFILYNSVATYVFAGGVDRVAEDVHQIADSAAAEISRNPAGAIETINRKYLGTVSRYPGLSLAVVPRDEPPPVAPGAASPPTNDRILSAGPWRHTAQVQPLVPIWVRDDPEGFDGRLTVRSEQSTEGMLVFRSAVHTAERRTVIVDLPIDAGIQAMLESRTRVTMGAISAGPACGGELGGGEPALTTLWTLFRRTVAFMDCADWQTGLRDRVSVSLEARVGDLLSLVTAPLLGGGLMLQGLGYFLIFLIVTFFVIQGVALFFGALLARSITYAVHELFVGTERVQQGDFTHRIRVQSNDQLGELATSYNRMSASIDHLLHVQREKQRLDDELRIARDIQKSLLPMSLPEFRGVGIADLCEPAREVGGDYYDFFELGPRQLGVMIADVSGKGTSAALYMAELKGLMLSLTRRYGSPRQLLIEANALLSAHLDNRSFITMTYAVIDLDAGTITSARAGHTPLIVVSHGVAEVITPPGMVLGLRLPGAPERFSQLLEEHTRRLAEGDVYVFYTDGITEATDRDGELFSDEALARVVASQHQLDAAGIRERVVREVRAFVGDAEPHDDMTMVVIKIEQLEAAP
jgi:sigma-B regulation protein RsbU (phosphoserine phosphatase)